MVQALVEDTITIVLPGGFKNGFVRVSLEDGLKALRKGKYEYDGKTYKIEKKPGQNLNLIKVLFATEMNEED